MGEKCDHGGVWVLLEALVRLNDEGCDNCGEKTSLEGITWSSIFLRTTNGENSRISTNSEPHLAMNHIVSGRPSAMVREGASMGLHPASGEQIGRGHR